MGGPYFDLVLPTTKHEKILGLPILSYNPHVLAATTNNKNGITAFYNVQEDPENENNTMDIAYDGTFDDLHGVQNPGNRVNPGGIAALPGPPQLCEQPGK